MITLDVSEDVVLQHAERDGCNLGREVTALTFFVFYLLTKF